MRLLVVEDDVEMADVVAVGLRRAHWAVDVVYDGISGLEHAELNDYDVIVLDRDLPGLHGDQVCAALAASRRRTRVLMLTAASTTDDLVAGLGLGADDYLGKPFDFVELLARVGALLRRAQPPHPPVLRSGPIVLDTARRSIEIDGCEVALTPKEYGLLEVLIAADGRVVATEELLERVWDENADPFTNAVKITMSRLRSRLGDPTLIETVARSGYRMRHGDG